MKRFEEIDFKGKPAIRLLNNQFEGIIVSLGRVAFHEAGDSYRMSYDYNNLDDNDGNYTLEELKQELGDTIIDMITKGLEKNDLVYTGGIDDNRENNSSESDSQ
jgi:hypothetical protein